MDFEFFFSHDKLNLIVTLLYKLFGSAIFIRPSKYQELILLLDCELSYYPS